MVNAPKPDSRIVILGAGIIGNLWMSLLHHFGYRDIIVSEPSPVRRKLAEQLGKKQGGSRWHSSFINPDLAPGAI